MKRHPDDLPAPKAPETIPIVLTKLVGVIGHREVMRLTVGEVTVDDVRHELVLRFVGHAGGRGGQVLFEILNPDGSVYGYAADIAAVLTSVAQAVFNADTTRVIYDASTPLGVSVNPAMRSPDIGRQN